MIRKLFALIALAVLILPLEGQSRWGLGGCAPVGAKEVIGDTPTKEPVGNSNDGKSGWFEFQNAPGYLGWYRNGVLIGRWNLKNKTWQEWNGNTWKPVFTAPWEKTERPYFGVEEDKLIPVGEKWYRGGESFNSRDSYVIADSAKDDSKLPQVCILDTDANRRKEAFENLTTRFAGKARVSSADPNNKDQQPFLVGFKLDKDERFKKNNFATFVMRPRDTDGAAKVTYVAYDPKPAQALGDEISVRVDPNYDPAKNPTAGDGKKVDWSFIGDKFWYGVVLVVGLGLGYMVFGKKEEVKKTRQEVWPDEDFLDDDPNYDPRDKAEEALEEISPSRQLLDALREWNEDFKLRSAEAEEIRKSLLDIANGLGGKKGE